jgi:hypothetical protein
MRSIGLLLLCVTMHAGAMSMPQGEGTSCDIHPKAFIRNHGQWPSQVRYGILGSSAKAALTTEGIELFSLTATMRMPRGDALPGFDASVRQTSDRPAFARTRVRFHHPSPRMRVVEGEEAVTRLNFYMGREKAGWHENVGTVRSLTYENVWENIDLEYRYDGERLRQSIRVRPGGDPRDIAFLVDGADGPATILSPVGAGAMLDRKMPMEIRVDTLRPRPGPGLASWRQLAETEFCTFFGGQGKEHAWDIDVDGASRMTLFLLTSSGDLPVKNEMRAMIEGGYDQYLARIDCDGNTLLSGTYFGSWSNELRYTSFPYGSWWGELHHHAYRIHRAASGDLLISTHADTPDFPVTPDAVQTTFADRVTIHLSYSLSNDVVMRFSPAGVLMASTFLEGPTFAGLIDIATGPDGDVYVLGHATGEQWFITPGVVHPAISQRNIYPSPQGGVSTAYIVRLSPKLDAVRWGTYFFHSHGSNMSDFVHVPGNPVAGAGTMRYMDLEVDRDGCPVIVGTADSLRRLSITRSYGTFTPGKSFAWVVRLAADARSYKYATAMHGGDWTNGNALALDGDGNALIVGSTGGQGFPEVSPRLLPLPASKSRKNFIAKIDPSGVILNSALLEFTEVTQPLNDIALTRCGEIVIDFAMIGPLTTVHEVAARDPFWLYKWLYPGVQRRGAAYIVCDSAMQHVSFAAWGHPDSGTDNYDIRRGGWSGWHDYLEFDDAGYFYDLHGFTTWTNKGTIIYNTSRVAEAQTDLVFSRHHYPVCQLVNCEISAVDTIVVSTPPDPLAPAEFPIVVTVSSDGAAVDARQVEGDLFLPDGINTLAGDSVVHLVFESDRMHPNSRISRTVMVRATRDFRTDTLRYHFIGYYTDTRREGSCLRPITVGTATTFLRRIGWEQQPPECTVLVDEDRIKFPAYPSCAPGTATVLLILRNPGAAPWEIGKVLLRPADGMGVSFRIPSDSLRGDRTLDPGDTLSWTWMLDLRRGPLPKNVCVTAHVFERDGRELTRCEAQISIPSGPGVRCALTLPGTVEWDAAERRALTDPIPLSVELENQIDSSRGAVTARIDLARAPHLILDTAETAEKTYSALRHCATMAMNWTLHASEPAQSISSDTVVVFYYFAGDSAVSSCENRLRLIRLDEFVACSLTAPATLGAHSSDPTRMDTLRIDAEIRNSGAATSNLRDATLRIDGVDFFTALDSLRRDLGPLAQSDSVRLDWRIVVPASGFARGPRSVLTVFDQTGETATVCAASTLIAPLPPALECALSIPDSLHADVESGTYNPDPFTADVVVHNLSDTLLTGASASIDLANAPRLRLAAGEQAAQALPVLSPRDSMRLSWRLAVASSPPQDISQEVMVSVSAGMGGGFRYCSRSLRLDGIPRKAKLRCIAFGHDSAYYDMKYEIIVPDPLQVWYSIYNEGTADAQACEVSLLLPPGWKFADGVTNPALFGTIVPGDTVTRSWLISPVEGAPWNDAITLAFSGACGNDSIEGGCLHQIGLSTDNTRELLFTPLRMVFEAETGGPLPTAQSASVWTAGAAPLSWTATATAAWLDAYPATMQGAGQIDIRPNTTAFAAGVYSTNVLLGTGQQAPRAIEVYYDITDGTMAVPPASAAAHGMQLYPNPYSISRHGMLHVVMAGDPRDAEAGLLCSIHDLLGRELQRTVIDRTEIRGGTMRIPFNARAARIGPVLVTIRGAREYTSMLLLLTP